MKCPCGNELGKPRVKPYPISYKDIKSKEVVHLSYNGGFAINLDPPLCWFCVFRRES